MSNGSAFDYCFEKKNLWRRQTWQTVARRCPVPAHKAIVLYLAGAEDLDRPHAIRQGFSPHNLIAIDREGEIVQRLRREGKLAVNAGAVDVLCEWNNTPANVVFLDLCAGLDARAVVMAQTMLFPAVFRDCVCAFNLLRGRESDPFYTLAGGPLAGHRGRGMMTSLLWLWDKQVLPRLKSSKWAAEMGSHWRPQIFSFCKPWFASYKSTSGQTFDSVVYVNPNVMRLIFQDIQAAGIRPIRSRNSGVASQLAAVKAIRTIKINAATN